ncbi:DNA topoisomerase I [Candidatus Falkowbacteria bacterium RIFOXYB2_FULL_38_15]|uniref:DNA topoisomerase 1 n=1 Tax=Candidatus Falkowbacteria bacterium RIFOXYA2_FULL_38_12 TaxID=1797993 RepID=A0A1F5S1P0_9BACT|nr:MAG: DNA topoisomerase I [Candidatus Falkowbacteria bacterium RIFOXYA2_FULL_38_12]OGF32855.1 MAG: DNA topoisomerase I [Candidatus Falkowbacteria bacterium RIFOXYB2_FULL_38_15]
MNLVIVESPTKAKTISRFLGKDFVVRSSFGHLRDLPQREMGIDIENNFKPHYVVPRKNQKIVTELKKFAGKAKYIYFASDEDREGEAISWHLAEILKPKKDQSKRIAFHEITEEAILRAIENPREIDQNMVDAQQARRVLDRLVGYEISPFLWKKITKGLSAGRVQSVAVRLIVEREGEIKKFVPEEYWDISGEFKKEKGEENITAKLNKINGETLDKFYIKSKDGADKILKDLDGSLYSVKNIEKKETKRSPHPPFTTSTLQQEANRRLGFSAKQTMMLAQQLYEGVDLGSAGSVGLITYMRTDSLNLAEKFLEEAKSFISKSFGKEYSSAAPKKYTTKSKLAQEAHEAIRPTNVSNDPEKIKSYLNDNQYKLYNLIWRRAVASQMPEAVLTSTAIDIAAEKNNLEDEYTFRANGLVVKFDGFLKVYGTNQETILPAFSLEEVLQLIGLTPAQHFTEPPSRYSDASLVKALEEYGIGRPSTYAPTISTIIERGYVEKIENRRLKPTDIAFVVNKVLEEHFPQIVDYQFTAKMENNLDEIAEGKKEWVPVISDFYGPFKENLEKKYKEIKKVEEETDEKCEKCGAPMVIKMGRFGKFMACSGFPECKNIKSLKKKGANGEEIAPETTDEKCEKCGAPMVIKMGRFGKFLSCSKYPECKNMKPIVKSTNIPCPQCKKGEIVEKKSKRGRIFFACNQYPDCKFALWSRPTGEACPKCKSLLVYGKNDTVACSNKECGYATASA